MEICYDGYLRASYREFVYTRGPNIATLVSEWLEKDAPTHLPDLEKYISENKTDARRRAIGIGGISHLILNGNSMLV